MLGKDRSYAIRSLLKSPGFALTAIFTIALGIGASSAIFSVVNAVLLRPLPYREADHLVLLWSDLRARNVKDFPVSPGDLPDIRTGGTLFEGFAGLGTFRQPLTEENVEPEQVRVAGVTPTSTRSWGCRCSSGAASWRKTAPPTPRSSLLLPGRHPPPISPRRPSSPTTSS